MEIVGNDYNALIPLINSLERLGRIADAERLRTREHEVLAEQLQRFPDDVRARVLLACDLAMLGQQDEAVQHIKIAVAMRPADANILYNAACAYGVLRMKKEALDIFRRCVLRVTTTRAGLPKIRTWRFFTKIRNSCSWYVNQHAANQKTF